MAAETPVVGLSAEQLQQILATVGQTNAEAMKRSLKPENEAHPGISAFSYPEGEVAHPKPKLRQESYFCGAKLDEEEMTPEEIDLVNQVTRSVVAHKGQWKAEFKGDGEKQRLFISVPCKDLDQRMELPSLKAILLELAHGEAAADPVALHERVRKLEEQLRAKGQKVA